jgi:hypothetical protein
VKLVRRRLEMVASAPEAIDQLDFRKLMQLAAEQELVTTWQAWMKFRHIRNITSRAYDAAVANEIYRALPAFVAEAKHVLNALARVAADAS